MSTDDLAVRIRALADHWKDERAGYPVESDERARYAETAVRLCEDELRALLAEDETHAEPCLWVGCDRERVPGSDRCTFHTPTDLDIGAAAPLDSVPAHIQLRTGTVQLCSVCGSDEPHHVAYVRDHRLCVP